MKLTSELKAVGRLFTGHGRGAGKKPIDRTGDADECLKGAANGGGYFANRDKIARIGRVREHVRVELELIDALVVDSA